MPRDSRAIESFIIDWISARLRVERTAIAPADELVNLGLSSRDAVTLAGDLERWLGREVDPTLLWDHPTIAGLAAEIAS